VVAALPIPSGPAELTGEWLTAALRAGGVISEARVTAAAVEAVGEEQAFAGQPVRVRLAYDRSERGAPASLVAKFPAEDPRMRRALAGLRWYETEIRFYQELAATSAIRTPRLYYAAMNPDALDYVLLLEEVRSGHTGDQIAGGSLEQARAVMEQIARLHAGWWQEPRLAELDWLVVGAVRSVQAAEMWQDVYRRGWATVREIMPGFFPGELDRLAHRLGERYADLVHASAEPPRTLIHGDCRLDNIFFSDAAGDPAQPLTFIDWQLLSSGRGAYDIAYFLGTNVTTEVRREHEMDLLRRYHSALSAGVADSDAATYDFEHCLRDYRLAMLLVFGFWVQTAGAPTFPEAAHRLRDVALQRVSAAIVDLDAAALLDGAIA
jgi:aminoglycoside phosphotransferase (APT) family kinase protein